MNTDYIVVFITASNVKEAEKISHELVNKKLAACSNIISPIQSIFRWKNEVCNESETLLILKSTAKNFDAIVEETKKNHSYDTPEIIALPIMKGSREYLQWISDETK